TGNMASFAYHAAAVDVKHLQVMLRPAPGRGEAACEVVVSAGLTRSVRRNLKFAGWSTGVLGTMGGGIGVGIGLAAGVSSALLALPVAAGAALFGGATALGYRAIYRYSFRKLQEELERLLQGVDAHARTGGAFAVQWPGPGPGGAAPDGTTAAMTAVLVATTIT
ncbi:MAG TPA: hypothetical protein VM759_09615, partial [Longimicrobium sp.]|nr:hypothetical protein [Longimicrobium sp.]